MMTYKLNIGDVVFIVETKQEGVITTLVPGGYAIKTDEGTKIYPKSDFTFEKVGDSFYSDKEEQKDEEEQDEVKTNLDNAHVFNWSEIPGVWKKYRKPTPIRIEKLDYRDKGLASLADIYCGKDENRPVMSGVYFDDKSVVMTDAHKLFYMTGKTSVKGVYAMSKHSIKDITAFDYLKDISNEKQIKKHLTIDGKYPNYQAIIPEKTEMIGVINIDKLLSYIRSTENYYNKITKQVTFAYGRKFAIGFNSEFLFEVVSGYNALGYDNLHIGIIDARKGVIISPEKKICEKPKSYLDKDGSFFSLLMPVMLLQDSESDEETRYFGAEDLDYSYENTTYYDFKDGEIHNHDGSVAKYDPNESEYTDILTEEQLISIKTIVEKNSSSSLPITETALIKNGYAYFTEISEIYVKMKVSGMIPEGCYLYTDNYLRKTDMKAEDFPMEPEVEEKPKSFAVCSARQFAERLDYASNYSGVDDYTPMFNTVNLSFNKNNLSFTATDQRVAYRNNFAIQTSDKAELNVRSSKTFAKLLNSIEHETQISFTMYGTWLKVEADTMVAYVRLEDSKFPDITKIIKEFNGQLRLSSNEFSKLIPKDRKTSNTLSFDGKYIKGEQTKTKVKVNSSQEYKSKKSVEQKDFIYVSALSSRLKKAFSSIAGELTGYYTYKDKGKQDCFICFDLVPGNMPFFKTKPFRKIEVKEKIEFAPKSKDIPLIVEKQKSFTEQEQLEEIEKQITFVELMLSSSKSKIETQEWQKLLDLLNILKPNKSVVEKTEKKSESVIKKHFISDNKNELEQAVKAVASFDLNTKGYKNPDYYIEVAQYVKDFDMNDTLIQARYNETKSGLKSMIESIIKLDVNYTTMTDEEKNAVYRENAGLLGDLIKFDVIGRMPKNLETLKQKSSSFTGVAKKIADKVIDKMSKVMPLLIKFESMKSNIGVRKVLSEEEKAEAQKKKIEDLIYSQMPNVNKRVLTQLIEELKKSFKPLEKQIYIIERERMNKLIDEFVDDKKISVKATETYFNYYEKVIKTGEYFSIKELKYTTSEGEKIYKDVYYYEVLGTQDDYDKVIHDLVTAYVENQKTNFLLSVSNNFSKMTLPIKDFKKLYLEKGADGFEGKYLFNIQDGSQFTFKTQCVPAGGYNIQRFHYRYLSDFIDVKDSKGKKTSIWEMIDKYNKKNK